MCGCWKTPPDSGIPGTQFARAIRRAETCWPPSRSVTGLHLSGFVPDWMVPDWMVPDWRVPDWRVRDSMVWDPGELERGYTQVLADLDLVRVSQHGLVGLKDNHILVRRAIVLLGDFSQGVTGLDRIKG